MFDLFRSRQKNVRYILIGLLSLVALSLVITLIPGFGSSFGAGGNTDAQVIAEIGDETVSALEVRQVVQRQLSSNAIPREMAGIYVPLIAQQLVASRAVAYQAERMGFKVSDEEAAEIIRSILPALFEGGKFAGKEAYASVLANQNLTIPVFESNVKKQGAATRLEVLALEGIVVTPQEVEETFRKKNDRIVISYALISDQELRSKINVSPAEVQAYYDANKARFAVPEKRTFTVYVIEEAKIAATVSVPEEQLRAAYNTSLDSFRTPERVRVRHILLKTEGKNDAEVKQVQQKAEALLKQVKGGADFAELAKANSEDAGSAPRGGDIDWVTRGQTVPEFEKAAFSMKPGEISNLVKTMYGFHILRVEQREDARLKPFEEAKPELVANLSKQVVYDKMQAVADQLNAALQKSPEDAAKLAAANAVTVQRSEKIGRGELIAGIGSNQNFTDTVWTLPVGGVTPVATIDPAKLAMARVDEIVPSRPAQLSEVEAEVRNTLLADRAQKLAQEKTKEFGDKLKASNGDLEGTAKALGLAVKTTPAFSRSGNAPGIDTGARFEDGFRGQVGSTFGPVQTPAGTFFCKVIEKLPADLTQLASERETIVQSLKSQRSSQRRELLYEGIVSGLVKQKKVRVYEDNIKKLAAAYGS